MSQVLSLSKLIRTKIEGTPKRTRSNRSDKGELSVFERQVFEVIVEFTKINRVPPTDKEASQLLDLESPGAVRGAVWRMVDSGWLWRNKGKARWTVVM